MFGGLAQLARAPALQAGGQRFESVILHSSKGKSEKWKVKNHIFYFLTFLPFKRSLTYWHKQDCNNRKLLPACPIDYARKSWKYERPAFWPEIESSKGRMADALAHGGDEGRDKLR